MPEGHTLHALAGRVHHAFAGTAVAASSPQGRFEDGAALLDGRVMLEASAWGKHLFAEFGGDALAARPPRPDRQDVGAAAPASDRPGGAAAGGGRAGRRTPAAAQRHLRRRPARAHPVRGGDPRGDRGGALPARPRPAAAGRRPRGGVAHDPPQQAAGRRAADGPGGGGGDRQRLPVRAAVPAPGRPVPPRHRDPARPPGPRSGRTWSTSCRWASPPARSSRWRTRSRRPGAQYDATGAVPPMERRYLVYKRTGEPCRVCGSNVRTRLVAGRNLFWCGRCQRRR